jgi:hypothetical protein
MSRMIPTKTISKKESDMLLYRWLKFDSTLTLEERVYVIEKLLRRMLAAPEVEH